MICFALKLSFSLEKLYSRFHYFELFISTDFSNYQIYENCQLWHNLNYSNFIQVFVHIFEIHIIRKIFLKYMDPITSTVWDKNFLATCFCLKMKVLLWHQYQLIYCYENLRCSTYSFYVYFYYIIIYIFMYIELWCIITVFQTSCNA